MKRIFSLALCALLLFAAPTAIAAKKTKKTAPEPEPPKIVAAYTMAAGRVHAINAREKSVEIIKSDGTGNLMLLMGAEPKLVNNATQEAEPFSSLKAGDIVTAWHTNAVSASIPPKTACLAMLTNSEPGAPGGTFFEVEKIYRKDGVFTLHNQPQDYILSLDSTAKLQPFNKSVQGKSSAIKPGTRFLFWPGGTQEKEGAAVRVTTAVMLPYTYDGYILIEQNYVNINGYMLDNQCITTEDGTIFLPVQDAAKRLDKSAKYSLLDQTFTLKQNGAETAVFTVGQETYTIGKQQYYAPAPILREHELYVSLAAIQTLGNYKVVVGG